MSVAVTFYGRKAGSQNFLEWQSATVRLQTPITDKDVRSSLAETYESISGVQWRVLG